MPTFDAKMPSLKDKLAGQQAEAEKSKVKIRGSGRASTNKKVNKKRNAKKS